MTQAEAVKQQLPGTVAMSAGTVPSRDDRLAEGSPLEPAAGTAAGSNIEQSDDCGGYVSIAASPRAGGILSIPNASKGQLPAIAHSGGDSTAFAVWCCSSMHSKGVALSDQ